MSVLMAGVAAIIWVSGCSGLGGDSDGTVEREEAPVVPAERLDETWVVAVATEEALAPFTADPGWVSLVIKRDLAAAVRQLGPGGGLPAARAHSDVAAMYRQAALISGNSLSQVYGDTPEPTDPVGAAHLVAVGRALVGDLAGAREASAALAAAHPDEATASWHAPWSAFLAADGVWPPDLSALPLELPPPAPGVWPEAPPPPHYSLPEQGGSASARTMGDPGALVALALWHDAAAHIAAPEHASLVASARAGYRLPAEGPATPAGDLPLPLLFGSDLLVAGDGAFLADLHGAAGAAAVDAHADTSLLAWLAQSSRVEGNVSAARASDWAAALRTGLLERASARTDGAVQGHHKQFAAIAFVGALRSMALVAEIEGDREASGLLRINAMEHSHKATACPVGLLALAGWDASNRYPTRALELLHGQAMRYPSLEIARYGLEVLGLRVGSERPGETPGL